MSITEHKPSRETVFLAAIAYASSLVACGFWHFFPVWPILAIAGVLAVLSLSLSLRYDLQTGMVRAMIFALLLLLLMVGRFQSIAAWTTIATGGVGMIWEIGAYTRNRRKMRTESISALGQG